MNKGARSEDDPARGRSSAPASPFIAGLVLSGRYRLDRPLGEGGMGTVWVGVQLALSREVAIKSLRSAAASMRARLKREALALAAVHHPSIVQVFDYGETDDGVPYVVMELVRGETLADRIARSGPLTAADAVALLLPILDGLSVAHRAGVIHRDIKPDNVMLTSSAGPLNPKLLDFGIAKLDQASGAPGDALQTMDGGLLGTPAYMSPEQFRGGRVDERADVWGAAALLYHMLAGEPPFQADDIMSVMRRVLVDPPTYPRRASGLDGRLWRILMAALRKAPEERTSSALEMRDALAIWLDAHLTSGSRASTGSLSAALVSSSGSPVHDPTAPKPSSVPAPSRRALQNQSTITAPQDGEAPRPIAPDDVDPSFDALIRAKLGDH